MAKNAPANAEDIGSIPGSGSSHREGNGNPLQYSSLGNPMDRGAWWAIVRGLAKELYKTKQLNNNNFIIWSPLTVFLCFCMFSLL